jgi:hypothetical protein
MVILKNEDSKLNKGLYSVINKDENSSLTVSKSCQNK